MSVTLGVVIPVYNTEDYIKECIESLLLQREKFDEIIIVNDGSTDSSGSICASFAKENRTIRIINQENKGQAVARNKGIKESKSEYICFLDSDDYLHLDYVLEAKGILEKESLDILYFDAKTVSEYSGVKLRDQYNRISIAPQNVESGIQFFSDCYPDGYRESPCLAVYRREYLLEHKIEFPNVRIYEDNYFSFIAQINASLVKYTPQKLYIRRYRAHSTMTSQLTYEKWKQLILCIEKCWNYIDNKAEKYHVIGKDAFLRFLMGSFLTIYLAKEKIGDYSKEKEMQEEIEELQQKLSSTIQKIKIDSMSFETATAILNFQMTVPKVTNELWSVLAEESKYAQMAYDVFIGEMGKIMRKLPLQENKCIGIYGTGSHTERFLSWYSRLIGPAKANVLFIESSVDSGKMCFLGRPIINVKDITKYGVEEIIISSVLYENEMFDTLNNTIHFNGEIYRFYEKSAKDFFLGETFGPFDLVSI